MIRVDKADPPHDFEAQVAIPGRLAIAQLIAAAQAALASTPQPASRTISAKDILAADLPSYWTNALPALCASYNRICAYLGLRITPGVGVAEVDHYKPKSKYQHLAYDWDNYRLSCKLANSFKHKFEDVIDPFEIETGWLGINMLNGHVGTPEKARSTAAQLVSAIESR